MTTPGRTLRLLFLSLFPLLLPLAAHGQLATLPPSSLMEAEDLPTGIPLPQDAPRIALPRGHSRATTNTVDIAAPDLVYVPAATFTMGNPYSNINEGWATELPLHEVTLSPCLMARTEVPNALAAALLQSAYDRGLVAVNLSTNGLPYSAVSLESTNAAPLVYLQGCTTNVHIAFDPGTATFAVREGKENFPAFYVSWYGALSMANYLSDALGLPRAVDPADWSVSLDTPGFRIPTEAEWERAARGDISTYPTHFPWPNDSVHGDELYPYSIDPWKANYTDYRYLFRDSNQVIRLDFHPRHPWFGEPVRTTPVAWYDGSQSIADTGVLPSRYVGADYARIVDMANGLGLYDMGGNVAEWCVDHIHDYPSAPATNPCATAPSYSVAGTATYRVFRGGAWTHRLLEWDHYDASILRCAYRVSFPPEEAWAINGFRLVRPLSPYETWAATHFDSPTAPEAAPSADPDTDRFPNASEFAAGTDPNDKTSLLHVSAFAASSPTGFSLTFPAVSGRVYTVEAAPPSAAPSWAPAIPAVTATSTAPLALSIPSPAPTGSFIRIVIPRW